MSMHIDGKKITAMYWGGRKIREAWYEGERVFSGKPVEVMPPTPNWYDAQDWLRGRLTEYGESYQTVKEIPFEIDTGESSNLDSMFRGCSSLTTAPAMDTSQVTDMQSMFRDCSSLTTVPDMDTSQVTNMTSMFDGCSSLTTAPAMDTSQVTDMRSMFRGCSSLTTVPDMDTRNVTLMNDMFRNCSSLTDGNVRLIGKRTGASTVRMIQGSGLTREPFYDSSGQPI